MTFEQAKLKINSLLRFGIQPGLESISKLLALLDNPQERLKFVHVAGTNGKGSTCMMIASVLKNAGYKTGLFLSPYVIDFRERFQINGEMISELELTDIVDNLYKKVDYLAKQGVTITEFEFITAIAFKWFCEKNCDIVILEVGLGGRYDATNIISHSEVSVITSISLDHTKILGNKIEDITREKCGIMKECGVTVVNPCNQSTEAINVIKKTAKDLHNKLIIANNQLVKIKNDNGLITIINYKGVDIKIPFAGDYQVENTKTAICVLEVLSEEFDISVSNIKNGIEDAFVPARLEILSEHPTVLLDGAHNEDAMHQLCNFIRIKLQGKRILCLFGVMCDKNVKGMLSSLTKVCDDFVVVTVDNDRAMKSDEIAELIKEFNVSVASYDKNLKGALYNIFSRSFDNTAVIVCGSLYLASQIRPMLIERLINIS